jgi:bile acid:Na+ symporter, BASS family
MNIYLGTFLVIVFTMLALYTRFGKWLKGLGFTFFVFAFAAGALTFPEVFISWGSIELKNAISPLVQIILFGMGMTLNFDDFKRVFRMPTAVFIGFGLQYTIMPFIGFICARTFRLEADIAIGLILIGSCPGGATSNVIAYLAKANIPLSVTMTAFSTILSPVMTPLAMSIYAGKYVPIDFLPMMWSIVKMIILPLIIGLLTRRYLPMLANIAVKVLPFLAMFAVCLIIAITIAISRDDLLKIGMTLFVASACHNAVGYILGYNFARVFRLNSRDCRTVALEVGIQNGGMATGLAFDVLHNAKAALASATFGPWSAVTSSALASWWGTSSVNNISIKE